MSEEVKDTIKQLIMSESVYHPLTDEEIARTVAVLRETVTGIRKELQIPSSRERRKRNIKEAIQAVRTKRPTVSISQLVHLLNDQGFEVTRNYVADVINEKLPSVSDPGSEKPAAPTPRPEDFSTLVGHNGSLVKNIQQAKAAILYPPYGLPTLIVGDSGTGKSKFAECMYQHAKNNHILADTSPFVALNCADYGDNPQLLLSILYGHKKGAFTGADQDTAGLVERADGGILFLDEIHRLPPKGQEMLFSLLDKGKFRRLGEVDTERESRVYFIGATTESIESSLLLTFRRRIPMIIELPKLEDRTLQEKAQLIYDFFQNEANRTKCKIMVKSKILSAFALKKYDGNIGQLKSEIQVTCANAYVEKMNSGKNEINIGFNELLYNTLFHDKQTAGQPRKSAVIFQDTLFVPHITATKVQHEYPVFEDIYQKIEEKYYELKEMDISAPEIEKIIWTFVVNKFKLIGTERSEGKQLVIDEFKYLVGETISTIIKDFYLRIGSLYPALKLNTKVLIYLAIHLGEAIKRIKYNQDIINPNLSYIRQNFANEYNLALQLAKDVEKAENMELPEGEIGFIAMYIKELLQVTNKKNKVAIITVCHGKIASEMIAIVRQLMGVDFPIAIDMPFNTNPTKVFEQVVEIAQTFEPDMGILFFVDMGSLVNIGEVVQKRTGIKTRTIDRVDLVSVMEAVRKAYISDQDSQETLDDIYYEIIHSRHSYPVLPIENSGKPPVIVCMCLTGRGVATTIRDVLTEYYPHVKTETLSVVDEELKQKMTALRSQYSLIAVVGTMNPKLQGVNFIPFDFEFHKNQKMLLDYLIRQHQGNTLQSILREDLILLNGNYRTKLEVLEALGSLLFNNGYVKKQFLQSMTAREDMSSTCFKNGIAIPHGLPSLVNESAVVFIKLQQALEWDQNKNKVKLICLPAVKNDDVGIITDLFYTLKNKERVQSLLAAAGPQEFINTLCSLSASKHS